MAPVAKSTIAPGQNKTMSAIKATARIGLVGSPGAGLLRWQDETGPPKIVAHDGSTVAAHMSKMTNLIPNFFFISLCFND